MGGVLVQRQLVNRDRNTGTETQRDANVNIGTSYPHSTYTTAFISLVIVVLGYSGWLLCVVNVFSFHFVSDKWCWDTLGGY